MNHVRRIPANDRLTSADLGGDNLVTLKAAGGDEKDDAGRSFRLTGYTGVPVRRWWGNLVIDLAGMEIPKKLPILMDHDPAKRVGFADVGIEKSDKSLEISGRLLDNAHANDFARESLQGFPFQASIGVEFLRVEEIKADDEKKVNGRLVRGPCDVATKSRLRETSVLACGADKDTSAEAFSRNANGQETIEVMSDSNSTPAPAPAPAPVPALAPAGGAPKHDFAAIKAAVGGRADLALKAIEDGLTADQARGLYAEALAAENAALRKQIAAGGAKSAPSRVEVVPFGAGRESAGSAPATAPAALDTLAPEAIEDLEPAAVLTLAEKAIATDRELRREFRGNAADLAAFARADAAGRVKIYEPAHGRFGKADFALKGEGA